MKLKNLLSRIALGTLLTIAPIKMAEAQTEAKREITAYVDGVQSENNGASFIRPNLFYTLPCKFNAYAFGEFYKDDGYFGKNMLNRDIGHNLNPGIEVVYGSGFSNRLGLGMNYTVPLPKGASLSVKAFPGWFDKNGHMGDRIMLSYFGSIDLGKGFSISSFGEVNAHDKKGLEWNYGEVSLQKRLSDRFSVSYNPLLKNNESLMPKVENAVSVKIDL